MMLILDICHMMNLVRNTMMSLGLITDDEGNLIMWQYIVKLEKVQSSQGVLLSNKLRNKHIEFSNNKMKSSITAQTASALQSQLDAQNPDLAGCEATIKFILCFNNLFYIFNLKSKYNIRYKRPLNEDTVTEYKQFFKETEKYIKSKKIINNGKLKKKAY